jgi:hypothetical protein
MLAGREKGQSFGTAQFSSQASCEERRWQMDQVAVMHRIILFSWAVLIVLVLLLVAGCVLAIRWTIRDVSRAGPKPGMTLDDYGEQIHKSADEFVDVFKNKGWEAALWWLFKRWWKRVAFILFLSLTPGGTVLLVICVAIWALRFEQKMDGLYDPGWEEFKRKLEERRMKGAGK